jgi:uncharacterized damage-inducible protein DinB
MQLPSSISTRLQYQHKSLLDIIDGLNDEQVRTRYNEGKWSIFENIVHLQTYQHIMIARIKLLLDGNNPQIERYNPDTDPAFIENCKLSSREMMQDLLTTRKEMAAGILTLQDIDFSKTAIHPMFGQMTLIQWLNFFILHEAHHLFTIFKLAATAKNQAVTPQ